MCPALALVITKYMWLAHKHRSLAMLFLMGASGVKISWEATSQYSSNRSKHRSIRCRMRRLSILGMAQIPRLSKKKAVIHLCVHE
mgnify:CR=1 FL=1